MPSGTLGVPEADKLVNTINHLMRKFSIVLATKDWHPKDHSSFQSPKNEKGLWPEHCVQNSKGADFPNSLNSKYIQKVFLKGSKKPFDSYSGFYDSLGVSTGLHEYLKSKNVSKIYLVGLVLEYCVLHTALDAIHFKYDTYVFKDAVGSLFKSKNEILSFYSSLQDKGVKLLNSKDYISN